MMTTQEQVNFFTDRQNVLLPYTFEINGQEQGKNYVIVGGTHGNESVGVEAIIKFTQYLESGKIKLKKGKITFILGNPNAYLSQQRYVDSDLNRSFKKHTDEDYEGVRAFKMRGHFMLLGKIDYFLDIHSVVTRDVKTAICTDQLEQQEFLKQFSYLPTRFIFNSEKDILGTVVAEAVKFGAKAISIDCGNQNEPQSCQDAMNHIIKMLQIDDSIEITDNTILDRRSPRLKQIITFTSIAKIPMIHGFQWIKKDLKTGDFLKKYELYGMGDDNIKRVAPQDCYIFMPNNVINPKDNEIGFLCDIHIEFA
jgi:succinylglutamate desuccinylase